MLGEPYDGLIAGSILTLVTSVVILIFTNRAAERQWNRQRAVEDEARAVEQVYSPLYFTLWDLFYHSGYIAGFLSAFLLENLSESSAQSFLRWLEEYKEEITSAESIKEILKSKLGLIYPLGLRDDLFYFFHHMEAFERNLFSIDKYDFRKENITGLKRKLEVYVRLTTYQAGIAASLEQSVKKLIDLKGKPISENEYVRVFDMKIAAGLQRLLSEPANDELLAKSEEMFSKITGHSIGKEE